MAHSKQARKRLRQEQRRTVVNRGRRSRVRTFVRRVEDALAAGDKDAAVEALKAVEPVLSRSGQQGILKANTAARRISRLTRLVNAMGAAE
ncbi:MAG: 30S ribosomal protein S20 [Rhodospirillaceae bacterium]|jgi:small subunit ribosomal protein S20|nr:30S ribosomal protein S20 [Rhodospirillaceae bacterium]MBT4488297.1 30S ribosomal protein S20 [Rhodospirillaceae bacterium]MBT5193864.1 30S ribosomal protein S20 [Rhodospirillaceae bacterium]MBT5897076.1 30S ribosomal protein S20 [Rhodospirillaceae bacterium]MBT6427337.1 30S ribosomal protein S20 [Rhodospirillaceae bacterium]